MRRAISFLNRSFSCLTSFNSLMVLSFFSGLALLLLLLLWFVIGLLLFETVCLVDSKSFDDEVVDSAVEKMSLFLVLEVVLVSAAWLADEFDVECGCSCFCFVSSLADKRSVGNTVESLTGFRPGSLSCSASVNSKRHLSLRSSSLDAGKSFHFLKIKKFSFWTKSKMLRV